MKYTPTVSGAKVTSQLVSGALMGGSVFRMWSAAPDKKKHLQLVAQFYLPYNQPEMATAHCLMFS